MRKSTVRVASRSSSAVSSPAQGSATGVVPRKSHPAPWTCRQSSAGSGTPACYIEVVKWTVAVAVFVGLAAASQASGFWSYTTDDTFITLRYAWNLAHGQGLVYSPGEWVEGYSNPVWTVLLSLPLRLGFDGLAVAKVLSLAAFGATCALVVWASGRATAGAAAGTLLAVSLPAAWWASQALETSQYSLLLLLSAVSMLRESPAAFPWSAVFAGLAGVSRPEGPLLAAALGCARVVRMRSLGEWRSVAAWAALSLAPIVAWTAFRVERYGLWFPNTFYVKGGAATAQEVLAYLGPWARNEWPFWVAGGVGLLAIRDRRDAAVVGLPIAAMAVFLARVGGDWMGNQRLLVPALPFLALAAGVGAARRRFLTLPLAVLALALACRTLDWTMLPTDTDRAMERKPRDWPPSSWHAGFAGSNWPVTAWLCKHLAPSASLAYSEVGLVAFASEWRLLDLVGLVTAEMSGATGLDVAGRVEFVRASLPDWILVRNGGVPAIRELRRSDWLGAEYEVEEGGPKGLLVARRLGVAVATPAEAFSNLSRATARVPRIAGLHAARIGAATTQGEFDRACADAVGMFGGSRFADCALGREGALARGRARDALSGWLVTPDDAAGTRVRLDGGVLFVGGGAPGVKACLATPFSPGGRLTGRIRLVGDEAERTPARVFGRLYDAGGKPTSDPLIPIWRGATVGGWETFSLPLDRPSKSLRVCVENRRGAGAVELADLAAS